MSKHINPSWEKVRDDVHSPMGVDDLRKALKDALVRKYCGIAENMWEYNFDDFEQFDDMRNMTRDDQPEKTLMRNGMGVWFAIANQWHFLPLVFEGDINIYGEFVSWSPVPVGYVAGQNKTADGIRSMKLNADNSVIMKDSLYGRSDYEIICKAVDALVDNYLTLNQLTLLAKCPFVFHVGNDNILDAKNFFLALSTDKPAIFKYNDNEEMQPVIEASGVTIDPTLLDILRTWENMLLEQLGIPGSQKTQKRAQQSVDEVDMAEDMTSLRRKEKLKYRQLALDRLNALAGTNVTITSVIDSMQDEQREEANAYQSQATSKEGNDNE